MSIRIQTIDPESLIRLRCFKQGFGKNNVSKLNFYVNEKLFLFCIYK